MSDLPLEGDNEVVVTGALLMLVGARFKTEPVTTEERQATNELYVWPEFMKSRYRITVTLDPEGKEEQ